MQSSDSDGGLHERIDEEDDEAAFGPSTSHLHPKPSSLPRSRRLEEIVEDHAAIAGSFEALSRFHLVKTSNDPVSEEELDEFYDDDDDDDDVDYV